ncbi:hypothetical protein FZ103_10530 [Streptomonospora sp. PA3]|uniref:hypothetical protein n=1 Tax=Streptomonospora sp. PA3 TaxID=2607326 RepID=UPI0012DC8302|nr:hypothetical protein [Streptomonospora sp. PA3]MUL41606.1 hypothetical protein [Streptomonospora sp. PA3]
MLDPHAPATTGEADIDADRVEVTEAEIAEYVLAQGYLSAPGAHAFAAWLHQEWNDFPDGDPGYTNAQVIHGALVDWCGGDDPTRLCAHGYRASDSCPGCDAAQQDQRGDADQP